MKQTIKEVDKVEKSICEIRNAAEQRQTLKLSEWERLCEEGNENDWRFILKKPFRSCIEENLATINAGSRKRRKFLKSEERIKARAYKLIKKNNRRPKPIQNFRKFFEELEEALNKITDEEVRKDIEKYGGYFLWWYEIGREGMNDITIEYKWNTPVERLALTSQRIEKLQKKIQFPYTGFIRRYNRDEFTVVTHGPSIFRPFSCFGFSLAYDMPVSIEEIIEQLEKLVRRHYIPPNYQFEIKDFFGNLNFRGSERTKNILKEKELL